MHNMKISPKYVFPVQQKSILPAEMQNKPAVQELSHRHNLHFLVTIRIAQIMQVFQNSLLN